MQEVPGPLGSAIYLALNRNICRELTRRLQSQVTLIFKYWFNKNISRELPRRLHCHLVKIFMQTRVTKTAGNCTGGPRALVERCSKEEICRELPRRLQSHLALTFCKQLTLVSRTAENCLGVSTVM